jgi:hypothetical protein
VAECGGWASLRRRTLVGGGAGWAVEASPDGPAGFERRREGEPLVAGQDTRAPEDEALMSASRRSSVPAPASECRTMGERKVVCNTGCHAAPGNARNRQPRLQEKSQTRKTGRPSLRVQAAMECVGGRCDCEQSDLSQLKLFANSGERYKSLTVLPSERQLRHQRFSRVRTVAQLGNGEVKAKNREIDCCASTDGCKQCVNISDF